MKTLIWAHRGASHYAPENTMEAFQLAQKQQAQGIELDIHLTADGELAVIHDDTLDRVSDSTGSVEAKTMAQLKKVNVAVLHPSYSPARIPSLEEVYDFLKGNDMLLNVELKEHTMPNPDFIGKIAALENIYGLNDRIIYSSFNHYSLIALRERLPSAKIGLLYSHALYQPWNYAKSLNAEYLHPHHIFCDIPGGTADSHKHGVGVNIWTVDDPDLMRTAFDQQVDGLITNKPDFALQIRDHN